MISRRDLLKYSAAAGASLTFDLRAALGAGELIRRRIPATGEDLPIIGLGSSATFSRLAGSGDVDALREVLKTLADNGGTVFDTAPGYGDSEEVAGELVQELGIAGDMFWATKVNAVPRATMPRRPSESGTCRYVDAAANTLGKPTKAMTIAAMSQTWLASQTGERAASIRPDSSQVCRSPV